MGVFPKNQSSTEVPLDPQCSRCGLTLSKASGPSTNCPRCGAPRPDPSWTLPYSEAFAPTLDARRGEGGTMTAGKCYALVVVSGSSPGRVIPIDKPRITLGRSGCDVILDDSELSRQHAVLTLQGETARLMDLGSTNGTFVAQERIEEAELSERSEFRIGSHELLFVVRDLQAE